MGFLRTSRTALHRSAVIDIGSNSVRIVVYEGPPRAPAVIFNEKVAAGLGRGLSIDGRIGVVGSGNADLRSFMLNAEVSMLLYEPAQVAELVARQAECMALSDRLDLYEWRRRPMVLSLAENLARLVSPLL